MTEAVVDHRRATADRNAAAILDATERLLERGAALNMRAIAAEAGVSRPTLYALHRMKRDDALALLLTSLRSLFKGGAR
jgi:AcrR family transcriptional regulator